MQEVSTAWKTAQQNYLLPQSDLEITIGVGDPDAQRKASCSANGEVFFSNAANVVEETTKNQTRYATLEPGIWVLDGTTEIVPDSGYETNGYTGTTLCGENRTFTTNPVITLTFSDLITGTAPGLTITWSRVYQEWAEEFKISAYHGDRLLTSYRVTDNKAVESDVAVDIQGYDKITIEVIKWSKPYRRARMETVLIGLVEIYGKNDVFSFEQSMSVDPLSFSLPKSEITVILKDETGRYNPYNPKGSAKYLMQRQRVTVRYGYKIDGVMEWISGGVYFLSEWDAPQNGIQFKFTARDALEYMNAKYTGPSYGTLMEIAEAAMSQANMPLLDSGETRWKLDSVLSEITVPSGLDLSKDTIMAVIQYVANAACCVFYQDREGILHIEPETYDASDYLIGRFLSYQNAELSINKQLKTVNINNGQLLFTAGVEGEEQPVSNDLLSDTQAYTVASWITEYLSNRNVLSGRYRADPRLDPLDVVTIENQYSKTNAVITDVTYSYSGAFQGSYTARAIKQGAGVWFYAGDIYAGEV